MHVVFEEDQAIRRYNGERIPCLELKGRIPAKLDSRYQRLIHNRSWIPCQQQITTVSKITRQLWLDRLLVERLEMHTAVIGKALENNQGDWELTFYQFLAQSFGLHVNTVPFGQLARSLPLKILLRHKHSLTQIEALLFGQAGMLKADFQDDYPRKLKKEYHFLQQKYQLQAISERAWKFSRLRPANFPTLRLAQLATLIFQTSHLFPKMIAAKNSREIEQAFELKLSNYWQSHYRFDHPSKPRHKRLGKSTIHLFIINTIAPFLFVYGQQLDNTRYKDRALQLLEELPPERNNVIDKWKALGLEAKSAGATQALLQLKKRYCDEQRCLQCAIGIAVLKRE